MRELEDFSKAEGPSVLLKDLKGEEQLAFSECSEEFKLSLVLHAKRSSKALQGSVKETKVFFSSHSSLKELKICTIISHCYCRTQLCNHCCVFCSRNVLTWRSKQKLYCHCVNVKGML